MCDAQVRGPVRHGLPTQMVSTELGFDVGHGVVQCIEKLGIAWEVAPRIPVCPGSSSSYCGNEQMWFGSRFTPPFRLERLAIGFALRPFSPRSLGTVSEESNSAFGCKPRHRLFAVYSRVPMYHDEIGIGWCLDCRESIRDSKSDIVTPIDRGIPEVVVGGSRRGGGGTPGKGRTASQRHDREGGRGLEETATGKTHGYTTYERAKNIAKIKSYS